MLQELKSKNLLKERAVWSLFVTIRKGVAQLIYHSRVCGILQKILCCSKGMW